MDPSIFQRLSDTEHRSLMSQLEFAIENHAKWLAGINRALICDVRPDDDDLSDSPHMHCLLGRWYYDIDDPHINEQPSYLELGSVHRQVHMQSKALLEKRKAGESIGREEYNIFIDHCEQLRDLARQLYDGLKDDLYISSMLLGNIFENANEGVVVTSPDTTILSINKAFTRLTGYSPEEAIGQTPSLLYSGRQDKTFYANMWDNLYKFGYWQGEIWNRRKSGEIYLEWLSISAIRNESGQLSHYLAIFSDITEEREKEEQLYRLAHYDNLTGLPNRMLFRDRLNQALHHARRSASMVALLFLDLDGFKEVNDEYGHTCGDRLLQQVGERLKVLLRSSDSVGRYGGDEFTIVINQAQERSDITEVADRVIDAMREPFEIDGREHRISTSIGICIYPEHCDSAETMFKYADAAMYVAKHHGKNGYHIHGAPEP